MEPTNISDDAAKLVLAPILDVRAATSLHQDFLARRGTPIFVDAGAVERVGGQCAAILLSAYQSWASDGHKMRIVTMSTGLADGLKLLGIDPVDIGAARSEKVVVELS